MRRAAARLVLVDALRRMTSRLAIQAKKHARNLRIFTAWRTEWLTKQRGLIADALTPACRNASASWGAIWAPDNMALRLTTSFSAAFDGLEEGDQLSEEVGRIADRQIAELPAILAAGDTNH